MHNFNCGLEGVLLNEITKKSDANAPVPEEIQTIFFKILKQGIYKELHNRHLLSDEQLNSLTKAE